VLRIAERKQTKCKQCFSPLKGKGNKQLKKVLNVKHEVNRIYKKCKICSNLFYTTPYYRNKIYCSKVCYFNDSNIKNLKYKPKFNKKACEYFNKLNETLNWNGVHGLNEGEKKIRKYWVDYYEPKLNIVIEWDEKFHSSQSEEDMIRCLEIIKYTNCKFYRIDGETLEIVKIDKNGNIKKQKKDCWFRTQNI
jgi:very-short-patch-repair endonuclease